MSDISKRLTELDLDNPDDVDWLYKWAQEAEKQLNQLRSTGSDILTPEEVYNVCVECGLPCVTTTRNGASCCAKHLQAQCDKLHREGYRKEEEVKQEMFVEMVRLLLHQGVLRHACYTDKYGERKDKHCPACWLEAVTAAIAVEREMSGKS